MVMMMVVAGDDDDETGCGRKALSVHRLLHDHTNDESDPKRLKS